MITYQDFLRAKEQNQDVSGFVLMAIQAHKDSDDYKIAKDADLYDRQKNVTINDYVQIMYTISGAAVEDFTASNSKIASNFFHRLNTQRCTYSLGNGIYFANDKDGKLKESLGPKFDKAVYDAGYNALIHKVSFGFWNDGRLYVFPFTEFMPLFDEFDGQLKAGIRFWQIDDSKPLVAILYEIDGYTRFESAKQENGADDLSLIQKEKKAYKYRIRSNEAGDEEVIGVEGYSALPVVPFWGSRLKQSTLVGMRQAIDSFDLIRSGFANDLTDCAQIYWLISNYGGMTEEDLARFRDRMKINHIVEAPGNESDVKPYTQEIPYNARQTYLDDIRTGIYEDFGGLDVHQVSADSTNDHLEAAYQPMDENADDFEYQCIEFVQQVLSVAGFGDDMPLFKRNKISNQIEQVQMVMQEAEYLDEETVLNKLPNITPDEVKEILERRDAEDMDRMTGGGVSPEEEAGLTDQYMTEFGDDVISMLEGLLEG